MAGARVLQGNEINITKGGWKMNCKSKSIIITIVVIAVLALALSVQAGSLTVVKQSTPAQQAAAAAYWTPQRISQATAMELELMTDMESAVLDSAAMEEAADIGPAGSTPSGMPAPDAGPGRPIGVLAGLGGSRRGARDGSNR